MIYESNSEEALAIKASDYLKAQYPNVIFHFDYGSGLKMTKGQAAHQKRLNKHRGYPDLFIAKPKGKYHGLYIELKKEGIRLKKKNGEWASEHIAEQAEMLEKLKEEGYMAEFGVGFENTKEIIDIYLNAKDQNFKIIKGEKIIKIVSLGDDELDDYELSKISGLEKQLSCKIKEFIYSYKSRYYEGDGCAIFLDSNDKWHIVDITHCSCFGPLEDLKSVPMEKAQVLELLKNKNYYYFDNDSNKLDYVELIDYLENRK